MNTYVVIDRATGRQVYQYDAAAPIEWEGMGFSTHDHAERPAQELLQAPVSTPRDWPSFEFLRRFTPAERILARAARKTDQVLDDFFGLLEMAPTVRNDDPDVLLGLRYMASQGYLQAARVQEILNG